MGFKAAPRKSLRGVLAAAKTSTKENRSLQKQKEPGRELPHSPEWFSIAYIVSGDEQSFQFFSSVVQIFRPQR
jgi:hypothetical protein